MGQVFVGLDWAEDHHDVYIEDGGGDRLGGGRLTEGVEGVARFHEWVVRHADDPADVVIATETDRGLFIGALVAAGYVVLAVNPMSTSRYRERHSTSGAKSDPGDAFVLAELARTDGHNHRPVAGDSELAEAVKVLARAHQSMIWTRQRQVNQLRSTLREFHPAALAAFDDLASTDALAVLAIASTPSVARRDRRSRRRCVAVAASAASRSGPWRSRRHCDPTRSRRRPWWPTQWARPCGHSSPSSPNWSNKPPASRPSSPTVLNSTRTPKSSAPCQDWG